MHGQGRVGRGKAARLDWRSRRVGRRWQARQTERCQQRDDKAFCRLIGVLLIVLLLLLIVIGLVVCLASSLVLVLVRISIFAPRRRQYELTGRLV